MLLDVFGIARAGAIVSPGAADADPTQLAHGMLKAAVSRGARIFEAEASHFDSAARSVGIQLQNGRQIEARSVVLATGYVLPAMIHSSIRTVSSSWAIATKPQPQNIWKGGALIWEDSKDYLYARSTSAGRIIIGGEDSDEVVEPDARDCLIPQKARALRQKLAALWPEANTDIEFRAGTFDTTSDGLPLIGPVPGAKGVFAAYGYGGNGITFSFLAARVDRRPDRRIVLTTPDRFRAGPGWQLDHSLMAPGRIIIGINQGLPGSGDRCFLHLPWNPWSLEALIISGLRSRVPNCSDVKSSSLLWHFPGASMA
jgi:FAD dependent oxidoreductase